MAVDAKEAPEELYFLHIKFTPYSGEIRSSCASMLCTSCILFIKNCHEQGLIDDWKKTRLEKYIRSEAVYREIYKQMKKMTAIKRHTYRQQYQG